MNKASLAQVKEIVSKVPLPDFVHDIEYELDEDHLGNPCVRIRVVVLDDAVPKSTTSRELLVEAYRPWRQVQSAISDAIYTSDVELWPYVSIVGESQRAAIANPA